MITPQIITSSILIIAGFLITKYPNLIAGYNTMSESEKEKIDIINLSSFLKLILVGLGVVSLLLYLILKQLNIEEEHILTINAVFIFLVVIVASIYANKNFKKEN